MGCGNLTYSGGLTHVDGKPKNRASGVWIPPPNFQGKIYFFLTIAMEKEIYWVGLGGKDINDVSNKCI